MVKTLIKFQVDEKEKFEILSIAPEIEKMQAEKLRAFKESRNMERVNERLARIKEKAATTENLLPIYIEAVKDNVTVGEISNTMRELWGEYVDRNS